MDAMADGAQGAALIPWPNRLRDGKYHFDGTDYQLALTLRRIRPANAPTMQPASRRLVISSCWNEDSPPNWFLRQSRPCRLVRP